MVRLSHIFLAGIFIIGTIKIVQLPTIHDRLSSADGTSQADLDAKMSALDRKLGALEPRHAAMAAQIASLESTVARLRKAPVPAAAAAAAPAAAAADAADAAAATAACPNRRPFHTVLTATGSTYQQWQSRIMYHHWKKQRAAGGACSEMEGFTRLCATRDGRPDGLEAEIPSAFTVELSQQVLASHFHFGVLNRPNSVKQLFETAGLLDHITSDFMLILETDHVIMRPIPNLATESTPAAFVFGYMFPNAQQDHIIKRYWPEGSYKDVQPVGPSPVLIHREQLRKIYRKWLDFSLGLRSNGDAEKVIQGWVQEMWGYSIAAASVGVKHRLVEEFQVEPGALSTADQLKDFGKRHYIFHYTYQFEYMLDGTPCQPWNIGEYSLDKRHFNDLSPAYPLPPPPEKANAAAFWLHNAWNEAMGAAGDRWPVRQQSGRPTIQTVHGRRRLDWFSRHANGFAQELRKNALVKRLAPSTWSCTTPHGKAELTLANTGDLQGTYADGGAGGPRLQGRWGSMNDPVLGESCPVGACLFFNVGYALLLNAAVANGEGVGDHVVDAVLRITTSVYGGASRGGGGGAPGSAWGQCARV